MIKSHEIIETVDQNGRPILKVRAVLNTNRLIPEQLLRYQTDRMIAAYKSLSFGPYDTPIEVEIVAPEPAPKSEKNAEALAPLREAIERTPPGDDRKILELVLEQLDAADIPADQIHKLAYREGEQLIKQGTVVGRDGEDAGKVYIQLEGNLNVFRESNGMPAFRKTLTHPSLIGEIGFLVGYRTANIVAGNGGVVVLELDGALFKSLMNDPLFVVRYADRAADRLERDLAENVSAAQHAAASPSDHSRETAPIERPLKTPEEMKQVLPGGILHILQSHLDTAELNAADELIGLIRGIFRDMGLEEAFYHNHLHNLAVTFGALTLLTKNGYLSPRDFKVAFLAALLHDFDVRAAGTKANVARTLNQLRYIFGTWDPAEHGHVGLEGSEKEALDAVKGQFAAAIKIILQSEDFGESMREVEAIIRNTDFPNKTRSKGDIEADYKLALEKVAADRRGTIDEIANLVALGADQAVFKWLCVPSLEEQFVRGYAGEDKTVIVEDDYVEFRKKVLLKGTDTMEEKAPFLAILSKLDVDFKENFVSVMENFAILGGPPAMEDWESRKPIVRRKLGLPDVKRPETGGARVGDGPEGELSQNPSHEPAVTAMAGIWRRVIEILSAAVESAISTVLFKLNRIDVEGSVRQFAQTMQGAPFWRPAWEHAFFNSPSRRRMRERVRRNEFLLDFGA
jgi:hypothetical protein